MSQTTTQVCGLCQNSASRQDLLQGDALAVCRACVQQGLVETLAQAREVGDGETLAGAHVACSYCNKPTPPSSLYPRDTSVGSSRICTVCLGNAHALLTQQIELDARRKISFKGQQDPAAAHLLAQHFQGLDASEVATSSHTFPSYLRADLQLALDELLGGQRVVGLHARFNYETVTYASLLDKTHYPVAVAPLRFTEQEYAGGLQHDIKVHRLAPVS